MPVGLTSTIVANAALEQIAAQSEIESLTDGSPLAGQISLVYQPTVQLMLRELQPDFARFNAALVPSAAPTPVPPWAYEFLYPATMVRLLQVQPPMSGPGALADPFDPSPIRANVAFDMIGAVATKVILTNQQNAQAIYISSAADELLWDAAFTDAVIRRLANPLAMAISGRPDFAEKILMQSAQMAATCEMIEEGGFRRGFA